MKSTDNQKIPYPEPYDKVYDLPSTLRSLAVRLDSLISQALNNSESAVGKSNQAINSATPALEKADEARKNARDALSKASSAEKKADNVSRTLTQSGLDSPVALDFKDRLESGSSAVSVIIRTFGRVVILDIYYLKVPKDGIFLQIGKDIAPTDYMRGCTAERGGTAATITVSPIGKVSIIGTKPGLAYTGQVMWIKR